ncbi:MAG: hypothetical protein ACP5U2_06730 [Bryobacteraceae bacterium]
MRLPVVLVCLTVAPAIPALAQAPNRPVVNPRGVLNAVSLRPAPSAVAPGSILRIEGFNLGPADGVRAEGTPLPVRLGDPPIEVLINGKPAPIFSARPDRILVQVPWDTAPGLATVIVRRGQRESRSARVVVNRVEPALRTANGLGYGEVAGIVSGNLLRTLATGLGLTQPAVGDGETGPADPTARPRDTVRAFVGGLPARVRATLSTERVGEFDVAVELPPGTRPGDVLLLQVGTHAAPPVTVGKAPGPELRLLEAPQAPAFTSLVSPGLAPFFAIASAARGEDGCYPSYLFDFLDQRARPIETCLTATPNARTPVTPSSDSPRLAALVGPPQNDASSGLSSKVIIFDATKEDPLVADLPEKAATLVAADGGNFAAVLPGTPPRTLLIDGDTGEVREPPPAQGTATVVRAPSVRADELPHTLAVTALPQQLFAAVVADDADHPTRARLVIVDREGNPQGSRDFPEGWVPLVAPPRPQTAAAAQLRRVVAYLDQAKQSLYVLSRRTDNSDHAMIRFSKERESPEVLAFPESWFAAACTPTLPLFNLELSRRLVVPASNAPESEVKDPCPATGFVLLDLEEGRLSAAPLPGQGQLNTGAASGDVNDFIYGVNTDPSRRNLADTLFVLDGVTGAAFRLDLPGGVTSFTNLTPLPALNAILAVGANRAAGDAGFVYFDLANAEARLLPTPEGFAQVSLVGVFQATRKLVARGIKTGGAGSEYLIYDLTTGDLNFARNPEGIAWVGNVVRAAATQPGGQQPGQGQPPTPQPGQPGGQQPGQGQPGMPQPGQPGAQQPGQIPAAQPGTPVLQHASANTNAVTAVAYDGEGRQRGLLLLRVP